nr:MAG TPA: hypothetical protein [Caudoviricetes sp.]
MDTGKNKSTPIYVLISPYWDYIQDIAWVLFTLLAVITPWDSPAFLKLCAAQILLNLYLGARSYFQHKPGVKG